MAMWRIFSAAATVMAATIGSSFAQDAGGSGNASVACMTGGVRYAVGEYACIPVCHGARRLARCDAQTTAWETQQGRWTYVSDACPSVMIIKPPWPSDWTQVPPVADMSPMAVVVNFSGISAEIAPKVGSHWN